MKRFACSAGTYFAQESEKTVTHEALKWKSKACSSWEGKRSSNVMAACVRVEVCVVSVLCECVCKGRGGVEEQMVFVALC